MFFDVLIIDSLLDLHIYGPDLSRSQLRNSNVIWTHNHLVRKWIINHLVKLAKWLSYAVSSCLYGAFDCVIIMSYTSFRVKLYSIVCLNVKEPHVWRRPQIWSLIDSNLIRFYSVCRGTLNHLAKLAKWLSCIVSTYLYGAFDCMSLSCHVQVSGWIQISSKEFLDIQANYRV